MDFDCQHSIDFVNFAAMQEKTANVLYLSYDGMTDPLGQSQVIPYLQGLASKGHKITLLSCEKPENFAKNKTLIEGILAKSNIQWEYVFFSRRPPIVSKFYDIWKMEKKAFSIANRQKFDIVHCRSYIGAMIGRQLKLKKGIKFLFDMRGFWVDERVEGGLWDLNQFHFKKGYEYFKRIEKKLLSDADYTISLTNNAKDEIHSWKLSCPQPIPIDVIPCCADLNHFSATKVTEEQLAAYRKELGISSDDFIITYLGSIGTWYLPVEMHGFCLLHQMHQKKSCLLPHLLAFQKKKLSSGKLNVLKFHRYYC